MEKECEHHYIKCENVWQHRGLWKHLIMTLYCEKCGDIIQKELDAK